jgi:hypothetical protein
VDEGLEEIGEGGQTTYTIFCFDVVFSHCCTALDKSHINHTLRPATHSGSIPVLWYFAFYRALSPDDQLTKN